MLYTSYFAMIKNMPANAMPVSISRFPPKWFEGKCVKNLAPSERLLLDYKHTPNYPLDKYERRYRDEILDHHVTEAWIKKGTEGICPNTLDGKPVWESETDHVVFCCFEKTGDFCHRNILAEHLRDIGIPCREATKEDFEQWKLKRDLFKEVLEAERE